MVYEHLRFAYPGAWGALARTHLARERRSARADQALKDKQVEFSSIGVSPNTDKPAAGMRIQRTLFGKRQRPRGALSESIGAERVVARPATKAAATTTSVKAAWEDIMAEPIDPPRVEAQPTSMSLRMTVDETLAPGGIQPRRPTLKGHARQLMAQYHVAHERAPDGGFFMVSGADGFDIGLVKPHAFERTHKSKVHAAVHMRRT
uniref:Uncharacterized protein n=1 Tax=Zooxanthella nutricula TaxID=1333877 RepID=A0A7S2L083_9DINO